jgi:hypothetical protein
MERPEMKDYNLVNCTKYILAINEYCTWLEKRNEVLRKRDNILLALEHGGVDNWEWYGESLDILDDDNEFKEGRTRKRV